MTDGHLVALIEGTLPDYDPEYELAVLLAECSRRLDRRTDEA